MIGILIVSCQSFTHSVDKRKWRTSVISWPMQRFHDFHCKHSFPQCFQLSRRIGGSYRVRFFPSRYATHDSNLYTLAGCFSSSKLCFRASYSTSSNGGIVVLLVSWKRMKCLKMLSMLFPNLSSRKIRKYGMEFTDLISFSKGIFYLISILYKTFILYKIIYKYM